MRLPLLLGIGALLEIGAGCSGERFESSATGGASNGGSPSGGTGATSPGGAGGTGGSAGAGATSSTGGSAGAGGASCFAPQTLCGVACVDLTQDASHCGACSNACLSGESCVAGKCEPCAPGAQESCYSGPTGTEGKGLCKAGQRTCANDGSGWGLCTGEVLPAAVDECATAEDENCDGKINDGCPLASCLEFEKADSANPSGVYSIDPDGAGGAAPFQVQCEMEFENGGWTRFNWVKTSYPGGLDPLGQSLSQCPPSNAICRGRIPTAATPTELLVRDITDNAFAIFKFDGSTISNAVLAALRNKKVSCLLNQGAWNPTKQNSAESWCGNGAEGGCDSFYYSQGCNGTTSWGLLLDGDQFYCRAAFKAGATAGGGCGNTDYGYLNGCACQNEFGELYYR